MGERRGKQWFFLICMTTFVVAGGSVHAGEAPEEKLALVLSGGGARGSAHIGVLRVLEELHIAPDLIVGTSMGSIVGGLYAAGWSPDEIEHLLITIDWNEVFTDRIPRTDETFRRKQDDRPFLIPVKLRFGKNGVYLPSGLLGGQSLWLLLQDLEARSQPPKNFDNMPIPYRAVATDIMKAEAVVIDDGSLATAMRASMAIPGMFAPVMREGRELVDGGSVANLPVGIAQSLGATAIIAVDITSPLLAPGETLESFLDVYKQMNSMLTVGNRVEDVRRLRPSDIYIRPELGDINFMAFDRAPEAVDIGESAARQQLAELHQFSADDEHWDQFIKQQRRSPAESVHVDRVQINNSSRLDDSIAATAIDLSPPETLDTEKLRKAIMGLYHLDSSGVIGFHVEDDEGESTLVVESPQPSSGRNSLQFGVGFFDDFSGGTGFTITARHQLLPINRWGGEWQNTIQVGNISALRSELYQPLGEHLRWFVSTSLEVRRQNQELWYLEQPWATYRHETETLNLAGGRIFGNWGEIRVEGFFGDQKASMRTGDPVFPNFNSDRGGLLARFRVDTENSVVFPRSGSETDIRYTQTLESFGSDREFEKIWVAGKTAWSFGETTIAPYVEYGDLLSGEMDFFDQFFLGGAGRLSGLGTSELWGTSLVFARLAAYHRLKRINLAGIRIRLYAGASAEAGNTFQEGQNVSLGELLVGGNVYIGADTPLGPAHIGYGWTEGGRHRWYLTVGDHF